MKQYAEIAGLFTVLLCYFGYARAAGSFCRAYLEIPREREWLLTVSLFAGRLLAGMIGKFCPLPYIFLALGNHLYFIGLILLLFREAWEKKLLAASMLSAAMTLTGSFCDSLFSSFTLLFLHRVSGISEPILGEQEGFLIFFLNSISVIFILHRMSKHPILVFQSSIRKWHILLSLFLFAITLITDITNWGAANGILMKGEETTGLYYNQLLGHAELCVLTALSMLAAFFYLSGMDRIYLEQKKKSCYDAQIAAYRLLEEQHRKSERLRHDMKNHIIALSGLLNSKEYEKLNDYLKNMGDAESLVSGSDATGNQAVDALLCQKRQTAENFHITWECEVQLPKACSIDEFDLCILFGNILDNALEACNRLQDDQPRFLHIQAGVVKRFFLLEAKNSTKETILPKTGVTNKENSGEHGIGLLNIHDVVQKYHGTMEMEVKDGCFTISILLPF